MVDMATINQTEIITEIRDHIERKIRLADLHFIPCPHMIVRGIFPDDVYKSILKLNLFNLEGGHPWLPKYRRWMMRTKTPYYHLRKQIDLAQTLELKERTYNDFWLIIQKCLLVDHWFEKQVFNKFPSYFLTRFGKIANSSAFFDRLERQLFLQRHEPGYQLGPHTDLPTRVFTCIFSFAESEGFEDFGTQLLSPSDQLTCCWGSRHHSWEHFRIEKIAPYEPNAVLIFFKTRHSFHAVRAIDGSVPNQRFGMQFQVYEPEGGLFRDLSEPHLMENRPSRLAWLRRIHRYGRKAEGSTRR